MNSTTDRTGITRGRAMTDAFKMSCGWSYLLLVLSASSPSQCTSEPYQKGPLNAVEDNILPCALCYHTYQVYEYFRTDTSRIMSKTSDDYSIGHTKKSGLMR